MNTLCLSLQPPRFQLRQETELRKQQQARLVMIDLLYWPRKCCNPSCWKNSEIGDLFTRDF